MSCNINQTSDKYTPQTKESLTKSLSDLKADVNDVLKKFRKRTMNPLILMMRKNIIEYRVKFVKEERDFVYMMVFYRHYLML